MSLYKSVFRQTLIYGIATVLPKMFTFLLVPLYTDILPKAIYGKISEIFAYMIFFNVIMAYGMETAFFRFYNLEDNKKSVISTSLISIFLSTIFFLTLAFLFKDFIADLSGFEVKYINYTILILLLDSLVIIPFSILRANQKSINYAFIKISNVVINISFNLFFLIFLPQIASQQPNSLISSIFIIDFQIGYIFISNIIASLITFIFLLPIYLKMKWEFNIYLWKRMMIYGLPILIAGIAFAINEQFDKILLANLLPKNIADEEVGVYSACYKLGLFMVLFRTAYSLGIEPFFFSHASSDNAQQTYAIITKYFVVVGSALSLFVIVFADIFKSIMIRDSSYWVAMKVVPLIVFANFFLGIYTNLSVWYKITNKTYIGAIISIFGAIITLLANFLLIPFIGYLGSAIATILAYMSMMFLSYYIGKKYYPIPYEQKNIFSYLSISILFSLISFYLFRENYYVGVFLLLTFLYIVYRKEKIFLVSIFNKK